MEQRVADQHVVFTRGRDVVGEAWIAVLSVGEDGVEASEDIGPWESHGEGVAKLDEEVAAVLVPGVSLSFSTGTAEAWGGKHGVWVAEDPASLVSIAVGTGVGLPMGPLCPVLVGVEGAAAPAVEGKVDPRFQEAADGGVVLE